MARAERSTPDEENRSAPTLRALLRDSCLRDDARLARAEAHLCALAGVRTFRAGADRRHVLSRVSAQWRCGARQPAGPDRLHGGGAHACVAGAVELGPRLPDCEPATDRARVPRLLSAAHPRQPP